MKIVVVIDQYDSENEAPSHSKGAAIWASRYVEKLRERGHEVRLVTTGDPGPYKYLMKEKYFFFIKTIMVKNGMVFARMDEAAVRKAFEGSDIIHFIFPFKLSYTTLRIAKEMDIPVFCAFHTQPENVTYNLGLKNFPIVADYIYGRYRRMFYQYIDHIHCPTQFIADQLVKHKYKNQLHVISNGVDEGFYPMQVERPPEWKDKYIIGMVGRLAPEKRQDLIMEAVAMSKYRDRIQLVFCGKGPSDIKYKKLAAKLGLNPSIGFYRKDDLLKLINMFDLYVHASEIEIEAVACWEALACGKVPVIADSENSATRHFALDKRSLFKNKDAADLCQKIEYWIEHPEEKAAMSEKYVQAARNNSLSKSIDAIEKVYQQVIDEHAAKKQENVC